MTTNYLDGDIHGEKTRILLPNESVPTQVVSYGENDGQSSGQRGIIALAVTSVVAVGLAALLNFSGAAANYQTPEARFRMEPTPTEVIAKPSVIVTYRSEQKYPATYTINEGDTLYKILSQFGVPSEDLSYCAKELENLEMLEEISKEGRADAIIAGRTISDFTSFMKACE